MGKRPVKKEPSVIDLMRAVLDTLPVGAELSRLNMGHIKNFSEGMVNLIRNEELIYQRTHKPDDGSREYKIWVKTGTTKKEARQAALKMQEADDVLLCGRKISSLPKGSVIRHRIL